MNLARWIPDHDLAARGYRASPRERAVAFVLALATVALVFVIMVRMGAFVPFVEPGGARLVAIDLGQTAQADKGEKSEPAKTAPTQADRATQPADPVVQTAPPPVPVPGKVQWPEGFIELSRQDYAATDVSRMKRQAAGGAASPDGAGGGEGNSAGEGPGGVRLHNAQWYREPTDAEIGPYLPPVRAPGSWAMIACRTVDRYHVEDCQELDESPRGSGLARALRQAAWQFLVRPPRINGKPQVGEWVRIRFDFTKVKGESAEAR